MFPFPLNSEFINNYRRLYGPVQLTSIMNGNDLSKSPHRRSPVDSKRLKGKIISSEYILVTIVLLSSFGFNISMLQFLECVILFEFQRKYILCVRTVYYHVIYDADMVCFMACISPTDKEKSITTNIINLRSKNEHRYRKNDPNAVFIEIKSMIRLCDNG